MIEDYLAEHCFDIDHLPSGRLAVRPKGQLGTIGWHPKAWQCVFVKKQENALDAFFDANKNWSWNDFVDPVWGVLRPEYAPKRKVCGNTLSLLESN